MFIINYIRISEEPVMGVNKNLTCVKEHLPKLNKLFKKEGGLV